MAHTRYQYQELTGPVWTEPVAERLAWLPSDRYAGRALARAPLRDWSVYPPQPPAAPPYDPSVLDWLGEDSYAGRAASRRRIDSSVGTLQPLAGAYNPNALDWLARDSYAGRAPPRGRLDSGEPNQPAFVYDLVDWLPQGEPPAGRSLPRARLDWSVAPLQPLAVAYDPSTLGWLPRDRYTGRALPRAWCDWSVETRLVIAAPYDPRALEWQPRDRYAGRTINRPTYDWSVEPRLPYDPSTLAWLASDRYYGRPLPFSRQSVVVYDPTTPAPVLEDVRVQFAAGVEHSLFSAQVEYASFDAPADDVVFDPRDRMH